MACDPGRPTGPTGFPESAGGTEIDEPHEPLKTSALIPFLGEIDACRSLDQAAGAAARIMTAEFGATGAAVFDFEGPISARPAGMDPGLIVTLGEAAEGGAEPPVADGVNLTVLHQPIRSGDGLRIAAAWKPGIPAAVDELRMVAAVLVRWLEDAGSDGARRIIEGSSGADLLNRRDFTNLIETIPAIVYLAGMGADGAWTYVSPQIEFVLGYTPEEWMADDLSWYRSLHPDDRAYAMSLEDERLIGLDIHPPAEYRMRTRDGRYVWIYERARLIRDGDGTPIWHGVMQDITALKVAERDLARKAEQQVLLAELGQMAARGEDPDQLLAIAVHRIARLSRVREVSIWGAEEGEQLRILHRSGELGTARVIPVRQGEFPEVNLSRGEPVLIPNWQSDDPGLAPYRDLVPKEAASSIAAPILRSQENFGLILVHSGERAAFTEEDGSFLLATASVLGNAIERSQSDQTLHYRLNHDDLTGLPNRAYFTERLTEALAEAEQENRLVAVLFLDIDHFKLINDGIGHSAGDQVLKAIAPRLTRSIRREDTVARFGGDEFGVILRSVENRQEASDVADRMLSAISQPIKVERAERRITASIGISVWTPGPSGGKTAAEMIQQADTAMYSAKRSGRARAGVFDGTVQKQLVHRLEVEHELHRALAEEEFDVAYQPIVGLEDGHLTGFEALVRWKHPAKGTLLPGEFVPVAEESDLIREIDTRVLRQAIAAAAAWNRDAAARRPVGVSVNFSARQLDGRDVFELVAGLLARHDLAPRLLTIELTETTLLSGTGQISRALKQLDRHGVRLALDDFGTGFSSLGYLGEFPLDEIKIDRKFIDLLGRGDDRGSAIADAIVRIGTALEMTVVAEAVTSKTTLSRIRDLGCHRAQGFLFSVPIDLETATAMVKDDTPPVAAD